MLGQFAMVNVELLNLIDDVKPILKMFVVYPKTVNAENAPSKWRNSSIVNLTAFRLLSTFQEWS